MTSVPCLHFSKQGEVIIEHTNDKCHVFIF